jgi:hypothetical protein
MSIVLHRCHLAGFSGIPKYSQSRIKQVSKMAKSASFKTRRLISAKDDG